MLNLCATHGWPSRERSPCAAVAPDCPWSIRRIPEGCGRGTSIRPASAWPGSGRNRSSCATVYLPIIRSGPQAGPAEVRNVFDFTQPGEIAGQRPMTTVPTQALFLMNASFLKRRALELASRITAVSGEDARLDRLWLRVLNRPITAAERSDSAKFLTEIRNLGPRDATGSRELQAWTELCHALLASNEFLLRL